ncbi:MAG: CCA-adding protein, partial [Methanosarcinales archaeon]|nr:CCA-adding protein [Methanosarcinales archaeon]
QYLDSPTIEQFFPIFSARLSNAEFDSITSNRGTFLMALVFDKPDEVEDVLYPQLFTLQSSITDLLSRNRFTVQNDDVWAGDREAVVVLELEVCRLPPVKKHTGPPVWEKSHAEKFKQKYLQDRGFSEIYIENGRYVVDIQRKYTDAADLLCNEIHTCRLGKHVGKSIKSGFKIFQGSELLELDDQSFREFLTGFFHLNVIP